MNGVQKVIKYCAMAFACFLAFVIIGTVLSVVLKVTMGVAGVKALTGDEKERIALSKQYSLEELKMQNLDISKILVDCDAEITVERGELLSIEAFEVTDDYEIRLTNGTFSIVQDRPDFYINWFWFDEVTVKEKVVVTIPEEMATEQVKIVSGSGAVSVEKISADEVVIDSGSGSVRASEIKTKNLWLDSSSGKVVLSGIYADKTRVESGSGSVTAEDTELGKLVLDTGSGAVRMERIVAEDAQVDTGSGSVVLEGSLTGDSELETGSGSVTLRLDGTEEEYRIKAECGSGTFRINGKKRDDGSYGNNVKGEIQIDSGSGSVNVEFETPEKE